MSDFTVMEGGKLHGPLQFFFDDALLVLKLIVGTLGLEGAMFVSIPFNPKVALESLNNRRVGFEIYYVHNNAVELVSRRRITDRNTELKQCRATAGGQNGDFGLFCL